MALHQVKSARDGRRLKSAFYEVWVRKNSLARSALVQAVVLISPCLPTLKTLSALGYVLVKAKYG